MLQNEENYGIHLVTSTRHQTPGTKHQAPSTKHQAPSNNQEDSYIVFRESYAMCPVSDFI